MRPEFFKEIYSKMQKISHDWGQTLEITRSFIVNQPDDYYQPFKCNGVIVSHGFIRQKREGEIVTLPVSDGIVEHLSLVVLERFKNMELSDELPGQRFLYSYIMDVMNLYALRFEKELELDAMLNVLIMKSSDYSQAFRSIGYVGIRARVWEKICRYFSMSAKDTDPNYEPLEDSLKDLVGYLIILLALTQE